MRATKEVKCLGCPEMVVVMEDDDAPRCDPCQERWSIVVAHTAIMNGEMDHLLEDELGIPEDED